MYKAAVIGLGNIGILYDLEPQRPHPSTHVFAYEMSPEFQLICGIDRDKAKESILHEMFPQVGCYSSLDYALNSDVLKDVDVISICTPQENHLDILLKLIKAGVGKILFCEKPIVSDIKEVETLMEAVQQSGIIIVPNISRRWNAGLRKITDIINSRDFGILEKINIRYTRGIYNTGAHLFDLLKMWTNSPIRRVMTLGETKTSACPEKTFSFWFEQEDGVTGYAEAVNDEHYYQFDIDLFCSEGKIEMRNSGDDISCYITSPHHLFQGFRELTLKSNETGQLSDACMKNAINNIMCVLDGKEKPNCSLMDAIYPLYVAKALEKSYKNKTYMEIQL